MLDIIKGILAAVGIGLWFTLPIWGFYLGAAWVNWDINMFDNLAAMSLDGRGELLFLLLPQGLWTFFWLSVF